MGQQSCLAGPASGITFAHCFIHCEHFAGKKGKTVSLLKWNSDTISTNYKLCLKWCNKFRMVSSFVYSIVDELWVFSTWFCSNLGVLTSASQSIAWNHIRQKCRSWGLHGTSQSTYLGAEPAICILSRCLLCQWMAVFEALWEDSGKILQRLF